MCDAYSQLFSLKLAHGSCGCCFGFRRFLSLEEEAEVLEYYKEQLQNEVIAVEDRIAKARPAKEIEV